MAKSPPKKRLACWLGLLLCLPLPASAYAQKMYFTAYTKIFCANLDGTNIECLHDCLASGSFGEPWGIALDTVHGKMYWTDYKLRRVRRANLDGSAMEDLVVGCTGCPTGIALDVDGGRVYWGENIRKDDGHHFSGSIHRADLDGSAAEHLLEGSEVNDIALDLIVGRIYWADAFDIWRANLDGSMVELVMALDAATTGFAFDHASGEIYLTKRSSDDLRSVLSCGSMSMAVQTSQPASGSIAPSDLSKSNRPLIPLESNNIRDLARFNCRLPGGIALDVVNRRAYWTWGLPSYPASTSSYDVCIQRAKLDGSGVEDLVYARSDVGETLHRGIALDLTATRVPTSSARFRLVWIGGTAGLLVVVGAVVAGRLRPQQTLDSHRPTCHELDMETGQVRKGNRRSSLPGKCCSCLCAVAGVLWIMSTFVSVGYASFSSSVSLSHGVIRLSTEKQPPPHYMRGRLVHWAIVPGFRWLNFDWNRPAWCKAISTGSWHDWSSLLGLSLPRRETPAYCTTRDLIMPLWPPFALLMATAVFLYWRARRGRPPGHCRSCGYNLTGNLSGICPECGVATGGKGTPLPPVPPSNPTST